MSDNNDKNNEFDGDAPAPIPVNEPPPDNPTDNDNDDVIFPLRDQPKTLEEANFIQAMSDNVRLKPHEGPLPPLRVRGRDGKKIVFDVARLLDKNIIFETVRLTDTEMMKISVLNALLGLSIANDIERIKFKHEVNAEADALMLALKAEDAEIKEDMAIDQKQVMRDKFKQFTLISDGSLVFDRHKRTFMTKETFNTMYCAGFASVSISSEGITSIKSTAYKMATLYAQVIEKSIYRPNRETGEIITVNGVRHVNVYQPSRIQLDEKFDAKKVVEDFFFNTYIHLWNDFSIVLNFMHRLITEPGKKIGWFPHLFSSAGGMGKNVLTNKILLPIVGQQNFHIGAAYEYDPTQKGNDHLFDNRLNVINESDTSKFTYEEIKTFVTDDVLSYRRKGLPTVQRENFTNIMYLSNRINSFPIHPSERRCALVNAKFQHRNDRDNAGYGFKFWTDFVRWLEDEDGVEAIYYYFMNHFKDSRYFSQEIFESKEAVPTESAFDAVEIAKLPWQLRVDDWLRDKSRYGCHGSVVVPKLFLFWMEQEEKGSALTVIPNPATLVGYLMTHHTYGYATNHTTRRLRGTLLNRLSDPKITNQTALVNKDKTDLLNAPKDDIAFIDVFRAENATLFDVYRDMKEYARR